MDFRRVFVAYLEGPNSILVKNPKIDQFGRKFTPGIELMGHCHMLKSLYANDPICYKACSQSVGPDGDARSQIGSRDANE